MKNTVQPDRVYLNLSKTEFEGINLPKDLVDYFESDDRLIINWVSGPNTKAMKKVFPILNYLKDDDIIIDADDDILFPQDLIESRLKDFRNNGCRYPISSNQHRSVGFGGKMKVVSATTLFQKKMLHNWDKFITQRILNTNNDDRTYLHLFWLNGYLNKPCTKWTVQELLKTHGLILDEPMGKSGIIKTGMLYDKIAQNEFEKFCGRNVLTSFGYWKK